MGFPHLFTFVKNHYREQAFRTFPVGKHPITLVIDGPNLCCEIIQQVWSTRPQSCQLALRRGTLFALYADELSCWLKALLHTKRFHIRRVYMDGRYYDDKEEMHVKRANKEMQNMITCPEGGSRWKWKDPTMYDALVRVFLAHHIEVRQCMGESDGPLLAERDGCILCSSDTDMYASTQPVLSVQDLFAWMKRPSHTIRVFDLGQFCKKTRDVTPESWRTFLSLLSSDTRSGQTPNQMLLIQSKGLKPRQDTRTTMPYITNRVPELYQLNLLPNHPSARVQFWCRPIPQIDMTMPPMWPFFLDLRKQLARKHQSTYLDEYTHDGKTYRKTTHNVTDESDVQVTDSLEWMVEQIDARVPLPEPIRHAVLGVPSVYEGTDDNALYWWKLVSLGRFHFELLLRVPATIEKDASLFLACLGRT